MSTGLSAIASCAGMAEPPAACRLDGLLVPSDLVAGHPLVFLEVRCQVDAEFYARWAAEIHLPKQISQAESRGDHRDP